MFTYRGSHGPQLSERSIYVQCFTVESIYAGRVKGSVRNSVDITDHISWLVGLLGNSACFSSLSYNFMNGGLTGIMSHKGMNPNVLNASWCLPAPPHCDKYGHTQHLNEVTAL